jgi:VanZ family protein
MNPKYWNSYWPGLLWTIAIFILLILPGSSFPVSNWPAEIYLDKWVHLFLFGLFVIFWSFAFTHQPVYQQKKILLKLFLTGIVFGVLMEVVQHFWVKQRGFEIYDILADAGGCLIGWLLGLKKIKHKSL